MLKKTNNFLLAIFCMTLLSACEKKESLWELPAPGSETSADFEMGENYDYVVYFNLHNGMQYKRKLKDWDLAFESGLGGNHLMINGGNEVQVYNTHDTSIYTQKPLPKEGDWQWDNPNGNLDSTAFGEWWDANTKESKKEVYYIDRGPKATPRLLKMVILSCTSNSFKVLFANMNGGACQFKDITKNLQSNYTYFDLSAMHEVDMEPPSDQWDLCFTKYRYIYYHMTPITPYYVCGTLLNTKNCRVYETRNTSFDGLNKEASKDFVLSKKADEIGYDWKYFDLNSLRYTITPNQYFVVEDKDGYLYKIKFIDFYNSTGQKGHPSFVFQRL